MSLPLRIEQQDPPRPAWEILPTMYDLPSENPEDPGLPDEFHYYQPHLLQETFRPPEWPVEQIFAAGDMNLYYDVRHPQRYKRPDWFAVLGVPHLYEGRDLRMSYVTWQEGVMPFVVVELLSESTKKEDLGQILRDVNQPPNKWEVYERLLRIPYYVVYERGEKTFRAFVLNGGGYREVSMTHNRFWLQDCNLGLGLWQGRYRNWEGRWLRWYDASGEWVLTGEEQQATLAAQERTRADQEQARADQERQRAERLAAKLRALGVDPDAV